jgi:hypothetical protein
MILKLRMQTLWWIIGFSLLGSAGVVAGAGVLLLLPEALWRRLISSLVSFAVGTLLGGAFLGLLPRALESAASLRSSPRCWRDWSSSLSWKNGCSGGIAMIPSVQPTWWREG